MTLSSSVSDGLLSTCFVEIQNRKLKLLSPSFSRTTSDRGTSLEESVKFSVHWNASIEAITFALCSNSFKFVDSSFFLERCALTSASWKYFSNDILLSSGDFVYAAELQCRYTYSSKL